MAKLTKSDFDNLYAALSGIQDETIMKNFINDLCTPGEIHAMTERLKIVSLLADGLPYRTISEQTGASTTTVTRVARFASQGAGGYEAALEKLKNTR